MTEFYALVHLISATLEAKIVRVKGGTDEFHLMFPTPSPGLFPGLPIQCIARIIIFYVVDHGSPQRPIKIIVVF